MAKIYEFKKPRFATHREILDRITDHMIELAKGIEFDRGFMCGYIMSLCKFDTITLDEYKVLQSWIDDMTTKHDN